MSNLYIPLNQHRHSTLNFPLITSVFMVLGSPYCPESVSISGQGIPGLTHP